MPSSRSAGSTLRGRLIVEVVVFVAALAAVFFLTKRAKGPEAYEEHRVAMGTLVSVTVFGHDEESARAAIGVAFDTIDAVEALTTRYSPSSDIGRINADGGGVVDVGVSRLILRALDVAATTDGAFDPTVAPLVDLWDFDTDMVLPDHRDILDALEHVGYASVRVDTATRRVSLGATRLDLDGIAKGYAVDMAVQTLLSVGVESAVVDAGGDIRLLGDSPRGRSWRVGVKNPRGDGLLGVLSLDGGSAATSGDYQRYGIVDGVRYHHILDPHTGYPARGVLSVTIVCERCVDADALATAVFVMGPDNGLRFVEDTPGVECVIASGEDGVEEVLVSSGLSGRFEEDE